MKNIKFYVCPICGNVIELINGDINHMMCCGKSMEELVANEVDASIEKHVPVYEVKDNNLIVKIGEVDHPMEDVHYIMWVAQVFDNKIVRVNLNPGDKPEVVFPYVDNCTIFAYCNLHGLWKCEKM